MTTSGSPDDPTDVDFWRPLRTLRDAMEAELAALYRDRGLTVRPRLTKPVITLARTGPMTIRELADALEVTHSAASQTVGVLRGDGLVETTPGRDARTRVVTLTAHGRALVPLLEAEWRATEQALLDLDSEIRYPFLAVVADLAAALERRPFRERVEEHLSVTVPA
ncbi:MarR family transcriptional regulator [Mumia sp. zg.B21]|uniref:MarR family winged helix-turn-helix transcriptional regulator n=1 Tax=Mumia sp. zg.B21 TaxID=2855447 RepID=UPI001C6E917E|nr:MarR family transcriptional regulator [Mumia sp. zg.B21]MBW9208734.1 MarR family transcriptional regulator [Mumia sp. zg.B21]